MTRPWLVKRRKPESIMARFATKDGARNLALELNTAYQTDDYYVEEWDPVKAATWLPDPERM
jgi:hypothetical protein